MPKAARKFSNSEEDLRRRAETILSSNGWPKEPAAQSMRELLYDLQVHQIELRMQNEELRDTQAALVEASQKYYDLYNFAPVGYLTLSEEGHILESNLTAARLLGTERHQLEHKRLADFILADDQDAYFLHTRRSFASGAAEQCALRAGQLEGKPLHLQMESARAEAYGGPHLRVTLTDVTERARANAELKELHRAAKSANLAKSEFLANMSHEIRTPLNAVIGLATILSRSINRADKNRVYLDTLKDSADALLELVNNMLDFAKIEEGMLSLDPQPFDLKVLLEKAERISRVKAQEKRLTLALHYAPHLPARLVGDGQRLHQVVMNLLSNALKFTEAGGITIQVGGEPDGDGLWRISIQVADTGIGIPAHKIETMFQKFTQEDGSISRKYGGTGLGLALCREFTALMGGTINVYSEVGKGSEFTLTLPLHAEQGGTLLLQPSTIGEVIITSGTRSEPDQRPRILLVDDSSANIMVASALLDQFGYPYDVAWNALEALERLERQSYAIMLVDVQMPALNGMELTHILRQRERERCTSPLYIIAMTAHAFAEDRVRCLGAGMNDYLSKPFEEQDLKERIVSAAAKLQRV